MPLKTVTPGSRVRNERPPQQEKTHLRRAMELPLLGRYPLGCERQLRSGEGNIRHLLRTSVRVSASVVEIEYIHPPSCETPLTTSLSHIWKRPRLHCLQTPSCPPCQGPPTLCQLSEICEEGRERHTNAIPNLPLLLAWTQGNNSANYFMTWDARAGR